MGEGFRVCIVHVIMYCCSLFLCSATVGKRSRDPFNKPAQEQGAKKTYVNKKQLSIEGIVCEGKCYSALLRRGHEVEVVSSGDCVWDLHILDVQQCEVVIKKAQRVFTLKIE